MKKRIVFGTLMIALSVGLLWADWALGRSERFGASLGGVVLAVALVLIAAVAFVELAHLAMAAGIRLLNLSGFFAAGMLGTLPFWWRFGGPAVLTGRDVLVLLGVAVVVVFVEQMARYRTDDALRRVACTLLAVLYLGVGGALVLAVRIDYGVPALVLFLAAVKFTDIGAYFAGTLLGRHKLIAWLSPGKTWEGLAGGLAAAAGVSILVVRVFGVGMSWPAAAVFGVVVGAAGQLGDLCESLLKRSVGAKDAGRLVPSFGGMLDIIDSPLLAAPAAMLLLQSLAIPTTI